MIDWLVSQLLKYKRLRYAVMNEVDMNRHVEYVLRGVDIDNPEIGSAFWMDPDGWRGWGLSEDKKRYFFNDVPTEDLSGAMTDLWTMEEAYEKSIA